MNLKGKQFTLSKARNKNTGELLETELRKEGSLVASIMFIDEDAPIYFTYDSGETVRTSRVQNISFENGVLRVTTKNTYYEFIEV